MGKILSRAFFLSLADKCSVAEEQLVRVYQSGEEMPSATVIFPDNFFSSALFLRMRQRRFVAHLFRVPRENLKR
jgi:hypothetical protein